MAASIRPWRLGCRYSARGEAGSSSVEMAMSMILLSIMIFGGFEVGLTLYSYHFVSEAAREGTRYAIVRGSSCTGFASACPAAASDIKNYVSGLDFPGVQITASDVSVAWSAYPAGGTCTPSATCNNPGNQVQVTVSYPFTLKGIPLFRPTTFTMTSASEMVISQ